MAIVRADQPSVYMPDIVAVQVSSLSRAGAHGGSTVCSASAIASIVDEVQRTGKSDAELQRETDALRKRLDRFGHAS